VVNTHKQQTTHTHTHSINERTTHAPRNGHSNEVCMEERMQFNRNRQGPHATRQTHTHDTTQPHTKAQTLQHTHISTNRHTHMKQATAVYTNKTNTTHERRHTHISEVDGEYNAVILDNKLCDVGMPASPYQHSNTGIPTSQSLLWCITSSYTTTNFVMQVCRHIRITNQT
jgi:hypothetical protein